MSKYCGCGRKKRYADADCCDWCYNRSRAYDNVGKGDRTVCSCGRGKYADADSCGYCDDGYPDNWGNR